MIILQTNGVSFTTERLAVVAISDAHLSFAAAAYPLRSGPSGSGPKLQILRLNLRKSTKTLTSGRGVRR